MPERRPPGSWIYADREARRGVPFWLLLWLWLDPFALARPVCDSRDPIERHAALQHNARLRRSIPRYVGRWIGINAFGWAGLLAFPSPVLGPLLFGMLVSVSTAAALVIAAGGVMLGR